MMHIARRIGVSTIRRYPAFFRYLVVGGCLVVIDFAVFMALVRLLGLDLRLAQAISRATGAAVGFFGHRHLSFMATGDRAVSHWLEQGMGYVIAALVLNIGVSPLIIWATFLLLGGRLVAAKLTADALTALVSYVVLRFVFRTRNAEAHGLTVAR